MLYLSSGIPGGQKVFDPLELDLESVVSYLIWVLITASVLNHGVVSLGPIIIFLTFSGHWGNSSSQYKLLPYLHGGAILQWPRNLPAVTHSLRTQMSTSLFAFLTPPNNSG